MKKIILLSVLMLMACGSVFAQTASRWGVTAGANYNNIHFKQSDILDTDRGFGPVVGLTGELNFHGLGFGAQAALLYSLRNGKIHYDDRTVWSSLGIGAEKCNMHYLDMPIVLTFKYHKLGGTETTIMPMVFAGPTFSFLLGKNLKDINSYKTVSVYLQLGAGVELFEHLQLKASYNFSIGETLRTKLLDENAAKNRTWQLTATYFFKAGEY